MKVSIVPSDGVVYVEGEALDVNVDSLPDYVHAITWDGTSGELQFKTDKDGRRVPNLKFTDFTPYEFMVDRWNQKKEINKEKAKHEKELTDALEEKIKKAKEDKEKEPLL